MDSVDVRIWGRMVGKVAEDPRTRRYVFEYTSDWARGGVELSPIEMPVAGPRATSRVWTFPGIGEGFRGLPGLLADALPDDFGNVLIEAYMSRKGISADRVTALDRLAYMGKRGIGALEFHPPAGTRKDREESLVMADLVEEARRAVSGTIRGGKDAGEIGVVRSHARRKERAVERARVREIFG